MSPTCTATAHGTRSAYKKRGCRCPEARAAMRREWNSPSSRARRRDWGRARRAADDFIDEIAIEEACAGRAVRLTVAERRQAIDVLDARGLSAPQIAERLHIAVRTVERHRATRTEVAA